MISSTAISREGTNISFMKYIPMSLKQQLQAKVLSGILMSVISMLLTMVCVYFLLPIFPLTWYFAAAAASLITIVLGNYASLALDILHPKLVWEQEAAAVKPVSYTHLDVYKRQAQWNPPPSVFRQSFWQAFSAPQP